MIKPFLQAFLSILRVIFDFLINIQKKSRMVQKYHLIWSTPSGVSTLSSRKADNNSLIITLSITPKGYWNKFLFWTRCLSSRFDGSRKRSYHFIRVHSTSSTT